jgi:hypothetical protein
MMARNPWHKRVQRRAAAMQEASAVIADVIARFEEQCQHDCARAVRAIAMRGGVQETAAWFRGTVVKRTTRVT